MKLRVLGSSGSESPLGHPVSFLIEPGILLDAGSAASTLTLEEQSRIEHVLLSHPHLDHVKDLAFLAENVIRRRDRPIRVHASADCLAKLRAHVFNDIIWPDFTRIPDSRQPLLRFEPIPEQDPLAIEDLEVWTVPMQHPGGCLGYFLRSDRSTLAYSGDTGATTVFWERAGRTADLAGVIVETSFPDDLADLAQVSGHLTPRGLAEGLHRARLGDVPVYVCHIKIDGQDRVVAQIHALHDPRIRVLEPGTIIDF